NQAFDHRVGITLSIRYRHNYIWKRHIFVGRAGIAQGDGADIWRIDLANVVRDEAIGVRQSPVIGIDQIVEAGVAAMRLGVESNEVVDAVAAHDVDERDIEAKNLADVTAQRVNLLSWKLRLGACQLIDILRSVAQECRTL